MSKVSKKQKIVSRDNHGQNIRDNFDFHVKYHTTGKVAISFFQDFLASIDNIFILVGRLGTKL